MSKQAKIKKLILIFFLVLICLVLIYIYKAPKEPISPPVSPISSSPLSVKQENVAKNQNTVTLLVNNTKYESVIQNQITIYELMLQLKNEGKMNFQEKTYTGMGKFIEEINGLKNREKNWIYYVNDKKAQIGISNYQIKPGDVVSWKYESSY